MGFLFAAWQVRRSSEVAIFAVASTFALTMIDIVYVVRGTIAPIYLVDAAAEVLLIVAWAVVFAGREMR